MWALNMNITLEPAGISFCLKSQAIDHLSPSGVDHALLRQAAVTEPVEVSPTASQAYVQGCAVVVGGIVLSWLLLPKAARKYGLDESRFRAPAENGASNLCEVNLKGLERNPRFCWNFWLATDARHENGIPKSGRHLDLAGNEGRRTTCQLLLAAMKLSRKARTVS